MKALKGAREIHYDPLRRKTFQAALIRELRKHVPTLGSLTACPLAQRIEKMIDQYFPPTERLRMGQLLWMAVDEKERPGYGKRIEQTKLRPVLLQLVSTKDIEDLLAGASREEVRRNTAVRLFQQAKAQGGVLTQTDVATITGMEPTKIHHYVKEHERKTHQVVPYRGTIHDMGPTLTHKAQICRRVILEGRSIEDAARETHHSVQAVSRYVQDYRRVHACLKSGLSIEQTSFAASMPLRLVRQYDRLIQEHSGIRQNPQEVIE